MQDTLKDLSIQKKENAEEKDNDASSHFAYLAATREMGLNVKVSLNHFTISLKSILLLEINITVILFNSYLYFCRNGMNWWSKRMKSKKN